MAGAYERQKARVLTQIKAKGALATFTRTKGTVGKDPVSQQMTTTADDGRFQRWAIGLPPGRSWSFRSDTQITSDMEELHVAPEDFVPHGGDRVTWKGASWKIIDAVVYDPDGSGPLYFKVLVGK